MAYEDFVSWARENKVEHSQPEFKPSNMRDSVTGYAEHWLAEFFNRMERYGKYMQMEERNGLMEASDTSMHFRMIDFLGFRCDCCFEIKPFDLLSEDKFGVAYARLAKQSARSGDLNWLLRPKIHAARLNSAGDI
ncbi:unnamed protein product [Symbiodinium sp. CCMP2456]|nr:unnamed protein product [Symbiodinium sp. CCMP2456]